MLKRAIRALESRAYSPTRIESGVEVRSREMYEKRKSVEEAVRVYFAIWGVTYLFAVVSEERGGGRRSTLVFVSVVLSTPQADARTDSDLHTLAHRMAVAGLCVPSKFLPCQTHAFQRVCQQHTGGFRTTLFRQHARPLQLYSSPYLRK